MHYHDLNSPPSECVPERGEDAVPHHDAEAVQQREPQADVLEVHVGASQQVPRHQLLGAEPLRHLDPDISFHL